MPSNNKVIVIAGYCTGISHAIGEKFGKQGYTLALLSRTLSKLDAAAQNFESQHNIKAHPFSVDLNNAQAVTETIQKISSTIGKIHILFWNPYGAPVSIIGGQISDFDQNFKVTTSSLIAAIQASQDDLKSSQGSILVTGGGLSLENDAVVSLAVSWNAESLAIAKAAQRKLVHLAHEKLKADGIYVGELTVLGVVKGTPFDDGKSQLTAEAIAEKFWDLNAARSQVFDAIA
jgi:short-subunit dehydrogenase